MLEYLVKARARRELFRLLWGRGAAGSVTDLSRLAKVAFSAAHRELDAMREAGLARVERSGNELVYGAEPDHRHAELLRQLATTPSDRETGGDAGRDDQVRAWLAGVGAPLASAEAKGSVPPVEEVVAEALSLSHRDATVARVLPLVLWRHRQQLDLDQLFREATRRDERQALGYFLELAGQLGGEPRLVKAARGLHDKRRKRTRMFFAGPHGSRALAVTRRNTPKEAVRWGYLMNMGVDSFRSMFEKFARP
jgi:DNA-binding transcriptional ArsR family regulator